VRGSVLIRFVSLKAISWALGLSYYSLSGWHRLLMETGNLH
jgi:hypothetical protein